MTVQTTSEHGGFIRGLVAGELAEKKPVDTAIVRDAVVNNLNHLTDEAGQTLINFVSPTTAFSLSATSTTTFVRIERLGPLWCPVRVRHDGSTYHVVTTMRVGISAAGTATFRVALRFPRRPYSAAPPPDPALGYTWVWEFTSTSTSGEDKGPAALYLPAAGVQALADRDLLSVIPSDRGDGTDESAYTLTASLEVWAKTSSLTSLPQVHGIVAREYIGT